MYEEGQTATHPKTGAKVVYRGGQWVNAGVGGGSPRAPRLDALSRQLQATRALYDKNFKGVGLGSVREYLPTPEAGEFNSAAAGLSDQALGAFRTPGIGSQSDKELIAFVKANQPSASDYDRTIEQKLRNIEGRLIPERRGVGLPDYPAKLRQPPAIPPRKTTAPAGDVDLWIAEYQRRKGVK